MSNFQPNPENFQPDITARDTPERLFVPIENYRHFELARDILDCTDDTFDDERPAHRDQWDDAALPVKYTLFERRCEHGPYFDLHALNWFENETTEYYFANWGDTRSSVEYASIWQDAPVDAMTDKDITKILRARHAQTSRGQEAQARNDKQFQIMIGRFSAGFVIDHQFSETPLVESRASDKEIRRRAFQHLYDIAQEAGVYADEGLFQSSLQDMLGEQRRAVFLNDETGPIPKIEVAQPYPDFEKTRKRPFHRLLSRLRLLGGEA